MPNRQACNSLRLLQLQYQCAIRQRYWARVQRVLAIALLALLCAGRVQADADVAVRTLDEAQALALFFQHNLALLAARYGVEQAQAAELIAAALPNPVFSLNVSELSAAPPSDRQGGLLPGFSPQIQQLLETAGKRGLRMASAELGTEAAELDWRDLTRVLANALRRAWYALLLAQKNAGLAADTVQRYQQLLQASTLRLKTGDIAATDVTRMEVESLKAQGESDRAQAALRQARTELRLLLGWPADAAELAAADAWPPVNLTDAPGLEASLTEQALRQRPDVQAAKIRIDQAQRNLTLARRLAVPDVTVTAGYARDPGNYFSHSGMVGFSLPLPIFYRQEGEIATASVALNNAELTLQQTEQNVRADVVKALAAWNSAAAIVRRFESAVLARIEQLRHAQEFAYQKGAVSLLELIDAERNYNALLLDYHSALANRSTAWADLRMALGEVGQ